MPLFMYFLRLAAKIATIALYILTIASAYGGKIDPRIWAFPSVLTLGFPYLAAATFIVGLCWLMARRFIVAGAGALTLFLCWGMVGLHYPFHTSKKAADDETTFRVMTYNVLHAEDLRRPNNPDNRTLDYILASGADIVCMQEVLDLNVGGDVRGMTQAMRDSIAAVYPYALADHRNDVSVLSRYPIKMLRDGRFVDDHMNCDLYEVDMNGRKLYVLNVHMASYQLTEEEREIITDINSVGTMKSSLKEFKGSVLQKLKASFRLRADNADRIREIIADIDGPLIICGDFNDVPGSWTYNHVRGDDMKDAYMETNMMPAITYNDHMFWFHLDQMLYRGDNLRALQVDKGTIDSSDHYPLTAVFAIK